MKSLTEALDKSSIIQTSAVKQDESPLNLFIAYYMREKKIAKYTQNVPVHCESYLAHIFSKP